MSITCMLWFILVYCFKVIPASRRASVAPHAEAIEDEPLDDVHSAYNLTAYGKTVMSGITGRSARSARFP
jgi:hypothetical protein